MEPVLVAEIQVYQEKIIGKKWKSFIAAFFDENQLGKSRIELYQSETKLKSFDISKTIMLDQVVSLKPSKTDGGISFVRLNFRDDSYVQFSSEELLKIIDTLSSICFPKKYVTIAPCTSLDSPAEEEEEFMEFPDSYPMLKLKTHNGRETTESVCSLVLTDSLHINGLNNAHCVPYSSIVWVATGEHCFGLELENVGVFEFATGDALLFVENLRNYVRFSCNFAIPTIKTICRFNRCYHPIRAARSTSPGMSNNSTMESVDSGGVYTKITNSADTSVSSLQLNEPEFMNKIVKQELKRNASTEMLRHTISFLQKKKTDARSDFEENAETDFVRLQLPKGILAYQNKYPSSKNVSFQDSETVLTQKMVVPRQTDL